MRPAGWCQPKGRIGAAPGATEPMGERGKCLYTLKNTSKSRRSAQNTKKSISISNSNNEPNFTLHEISGLGYDICQRGRALNCETYGRKLGSRAAERAWVHLWGRLRGKKFRHRQFQSCRGLRRCALKLRLSRLPLLKVSVHLQYTEKPMPSKECQWRELKCVELMYFSLFFVSNGCEFLRTSAC